uniref:Tubby C-terminal domain-containing protein n=1 Tax=Picea sitchensis TaxID=3332 RepID=D5A8T9_PICSI|nr:unknown [Picea sitchensis]
MNTTRRNGGILSNYFASASFTAGFSHCWKKSSGESRHLDALAPSVSVSSGHDDKFCVLSSPATFTVWKRSLFFHGNGFTVFASSGNVVFRVEDYSSHVKHKLILMDAAGNVIFTMRHKRLSFNNRWEAFRGDGHGCGKPVFSVIKSAWTLFSSKPSARVVLHPRKGHNTKLCDYQIKGRSLGERTSSFTVFCGSGEIVAQATRKQATSKIMLGDDVLSLVVQPAIDQTFIMGLLIIFNQIFTSERIGML